MQRTPDICEMRIGSDFRKALVRRIVEDIACEVGWS